jgi:hypothetical protein
MKIFVSVLSAILVAGLIFAASYFFVSEGRALHQWHEANEEAFQDFEQVGDVRLAEDDEVHLFQYEPAGRLARLLERKPLVPLSKSERELLSKAKRIVARYQADHPR